MVKGKGQKNNKKYMKIISSKTQLYLYHFQSAIMYSASGGHGCSKVLCGYAYLIKRLLLDPSSIHVPYPFLLGNLAFSSYKCRATTSPQRIISHDDVSVAPSQSRADRSPHGTWTRTAMDWPRSLVVVVTNNSALGALDQTKNNYNWFPPLVWRKQ